MSPPRASALAVIASSELEQEGSFFFPASFPQTDHAGGVLNAYNAAHAAGGGIVLLPPGNTTINLVAGLTWADPKVQLWGTIGSVLTPGALCTSQVLNVTIPTGNPGGLFQSFVVDGGALVANCILESVPSESSVGTMWINVQVQDQASPSTNYAWVNNKCEDNVYFHCLHPGNEGAPTTIGKCFQVAVPFGKITLDSCDFFGECDFNVQQAEILGGVIGPITSNNAGPNTQAVIAITGAYIYDGGSGTARCCIDTSTNLCNIKADGCYLVANVETNFVNGNIPTGNTLEFDNCVWIQGTATGTSLNLVNCSGTGVVKVNGGSVSVSNATTVNLFNQSGGGSTVALMQTACTGVTTPGTTRFTTPTLGAAGQVSTTLDQEITIAVTTAGQLKVAMGPTNAVAETIVNATAVAAGQVVSFRLPATYYVAVTSSSTAVWTSTATACA